MPPLRKGEQPEKVYVSKTDGSYLDFVSNPETLKALFKMGVTEKLQCHSGHGSTATLGYNPDNKKWYGWSHRAIYGFGIGSKVKKGDCGYMPKNKKEFIERELEFWKDKDYKSDISAKETPDGKGIKITWKYKEKVPNEKMKGKITSMTVPYPKKFGRGEWTARTMPEAKQMAADFAESVS